MPLARASLLKMTLTVLLGVLTLSHSLSAQAASVSIVASEAAAMKKFTEIYAPPLIRPDGTGVKPEELAKLRTLTAQGNPLIAKVAEEHAKMKPEEFGGFKSLVAAPLGEAMKLFTRLSRAYAVARPKEAAEIKTRRISSVPPRAWR